ncbi:MAG: hypothetical protein ACF8XB_18145 [Planctomycetota bacterium JB042]
MRKKDAALIAYVVVCALMLVWPGYALIGNRVRPFVLGIPLVLLWNFAWAVATFLVLLAYDRAGARAERE